MEIWKPIYNYNYQVSNWGRIKRGKNSVVPLYISKKGYYYIKIWKDDKYKNKFVHKLIAETFLGLKSGLEVDHINN